MYDEFHFVGTHSEFKDLEESVDFKIRLFWLDLYLPSISHHNEMEPVILQCCSSYTRSLP